MLPKKLKGTATSINEDFTARVPGIRRSLLPFLKEAKETNKKVKLSYDKLIVDGQAFKWNKETKRPVAIKTA